MQEKVPADRVRLAGDLDRALAIVSAFVDLGCALSAVQASFQSNSFQLLEEVPVGLAVFVYENPSAMGRVLLAVLKSVTRLAGIGTVRFS